MFPSNSASHLKTVLISMANQLTGRHIDSKICFIHVPKCGGTSLFTGMKRTLPFKQLRHFGSLSAYNSIVALEKGCGKKFNYSQEMVLEVMRLREQVAMYLLSDPNLCILAGHFAFSQSLYRSFGTEFGFTTLLREPTARWFSNYFFHQGRSSSHSIHSDIETFIDSPLGVQAGSDYVMFLGGLRDDLNYGDELAIQNAKQNLSDKIVLAGTLENLPSFELEFLNSFGKQLEVPIQNKNPISAKAQQQVISDSIREKVADICRPNQAIYDHVVQLSSEAPNR